MAQPLKVLISAYACRPGMGSEPGVGWNIAREVSKYHNVWVITRENNRTSIEAELAKNPIPNLNFIYCEPPIWARWLKARQLLHYYFWQLSAYFSARKQHREIEFDIVHHVTYVRYSTPSFLAFLPVPFVWGPVGGGESAPKEFWKSFSLRARSYEILRALTHRIGEFDPFLSLTIKRSLLIRATTKDTAKRLRYLGAANVQISSESGLSQEEIETLSSSPLPSHTPVRFISMARLLHWKGLHLGLRAFAQANLSSNTEYWILGEGPERASLQDLAEQLNIASRVKFLGRLTRDETLQRLGECHVLVHPSLHDSGGWVCLEAMAAGRPIICLNLGGPAIQVTEATGVKIDACTPDQTVQELAQTMVILASNPEQRSCLGQAGQQRVKELYSWQVKGQEFSQLYITLLEKTIQNQESGFQC